jgi:hypothetical protein
MTSVTMTDTSSPMSRTLAELERVIEKGMQTFIEVGNALLEIRESQLYRASYPTFEAYCRERWGWSRIHAHRHIDAARVTALLPMGNSPSSERVARELIPLAQNPSEARVAWEEAVKRHGAKPTAAQVRAIVRGAHSPRRLPSMPWDYTEVRSRISMALSNIMMDVPNGVDREPIALHLEDLAKYYREPVA